MSKKQLYKEVAYTLTGVMLIVVNAVLFTIVGIAYGL